MTMWLNVVMVIIPLTCFFGVTFGLFLLYLSLKIKVEFSPELRTEMKENKRIYSFIDKKVRVSPRDLVQVLEGLRPENSNYYSRLRQCEKELKERTNEKPRTLINDRGMFSLSFEAKKFLLYENPILNQLLKYIFYVYIKRQPVKLIIG